VRSGLWHCGGFAFPAQRLIERLRAASVPAPSEALVEHYWDTCIDVVNSTGDQFSLLRESLPGDRVQLNSYAQGYDNDNVAMRPISGA
jgi:hypothetical protein